MRNPVWKAVLKTVSSLMLAAGLAAGAHANIVEHADGSFSATVGGQVVVISEDLADSVIAALGEAKDNPADLEKALQTIVATHASGADNAPLAAAIAILAISRSAGSSGAATAIINGVTAGNPSTTPQIVLRALSENVPRARRAQLRSRDARDTAEDLGRSASPVN